MAQEWESPQTVGEYAPSGPEVAAAYSMRPLSIGELLDRTFSIYRSRFWLFAGISSVSATVYTLANAASMLVGHFVRAKYGASIEVVSRMIGSYVAAIVFFLVTASVTQAAAVMALSEVYQGRETTVQGALRATVGKWYRYLGIALWQTWSYVWVPLLLIVPGFLLFRFRTKTGLEVLGGFLIFAGAIGGFAYGVIAYLRNSLGVPASLIEGLTVRQSMRRSKVLAAGSKGRLFVVLLIAGVLLYVAAILEAPLNFIMMASPLKEHVVLEVVTLVVMFVSRTLVSPVAMLGLTLVYFDQRVRKEAFDLFLMMGPEIAATPVMPVAAAVVSQELVAEPWAETRSDGMGPEDDGIR
jgi:hypothetical protein